MKETHVKNTPAFMPVSFLGENFEIKSRFFFHLPLLDGPPKHTPSLICRTEGSFVIYFFPSMVWRQLPAPDFVGRKKWIRLFVAVVDGDSDENGARPVCSLERLGARRGVASQQTHIPSLNRAYVHYLPHRPRSYRTHNIPPRHFPLCLVG